MANGIFDPQEVMQQLIASGLLGNTFNERWGNMPDTFAGRWGDMSSANLARNQGTQDPAKAMRQMEANQRVSDIGSHFMKGLLDYYQMPGNAAQGLYTPPQADPNVLTEQDVEARNQGAERMLRGAPQMALETLGLASPFVARETAGAVGAMGGKLPPGKPPIPANENIPVPPPVKVGSYEIPPPLQLKDRILDNYSHVISPNDVLASEPIWSGAAKLAGQTGMPEHIAFAELANGMWQRQGANRYISPEMAQSYIRQERGKSAGINVVKP